MTSPNIISNGGFDSGTDGWQVQGQDASLVWSADIGVPPGSALLQIEPDANTFQGASVFQCLLVVPAGYYVAQSHLLLQAPGTVSNVFMDWFAALDCSGTPIREGGIRPIAFIGPDDQWQFGGVAQGAPTGAQAVRIGVFLGRLQPSDLPSQVYIDNVSLQHLSADPPSPADRFVNVQVRGQDISGHVQVRVEVAPNGNYLLHTKVLRARGTGTFCVGFGYEPLGTASGCAQPPWTFTVEGASKNPLAFSGEWIPTLPCVVVFSDPHTLNAVAYGRLNFAGCPD